MLFFRQQPYNNVLSVHSDNEDIEKSREIHAVYVFDKTGVILKQEHGTFERNINIDVACVKKVKVDFNCKTAFLITHQRSFSFDELKYDVYIPVSVLGLKEPVYKKEMNTYSKGIKKIFDTKYEGLSFWKFKRLDEKLYQISREIDEQGKMIDHYNLTYEPERFDNALKQVKKLFAKYQKELERIENYTVEDAIKEGF